MILLSWLRSSKRGKIRTLEWLVDTKKAALS